MNLVVLSKDFKVHRRSGVHFNNSRSRKFFFKNFRLLEALRFFRRTNVLTWFFFLDNSSPGHFRSCVEVNTLLSAGQAPYYCASFEIGGKCNEINLSIALCTLRLSLIILIVLRLSVSTWAKLCTKRTEPQRCDVHKAQIKTTQDHAVSITTVCEHSARCRIPRTTSAFTTNGLARLYRSS